MSSQVVTIANLYTTITKLNKLKLSGGKRYTTIATLLQKEATTHNCAEVFSLLAKLEASV